MKKILKSLNITLLAFMLLPMAVFAQETGLNMESYQNLPYTTYMNEKGENASIPRDEVYYLINGSDFQNSEKTGGWYIVPPNFTGTVLIGDISITGAANLVVGENSQVVLNGSVYLNRNSKLNIYAQNPNAIKLTFLSENSQAVISGEGAFNNYSGTTSIENSNAEYGLCMSTSIVNCYGGTLSLINQNAIANAVVAPSTRLAVYGGDFYALTRVGNEYKGMSTGAVPSLIKGNSVFASKDALEFINVGLNTMLVALDSFETIDGVNVYTGNGVILGNVALGMNDLSVKVSNLEVTGGSKLVIGENKSLKTDRLQNDGDILVKKGGELNYNSMSGEGTVNNENSNSTRTGRTLNHVNSSSLIIDDSSTDTNLTGSKASQTITGIKPAIKEVYVDSSKPYAPINNLVTEPFEKPITDDVTFSSSSFQINGEEVDNTYTLTAPSSSYNGNTIVTASCKIGNEEYSTSFSVNFVSKANKDVKGISVPVQLSFNLIDPNTQNVSATLLPENCTNYNQDVSYITLFDYASTDEAVASVDQYGNITPKGVGSCIIKTSYGDESESPLYVGETEVIVINENIGSITLNPLLLNLNLENKSTGIMTANIYPSDLGLIPNWSVSNELVCSIKPNGLQVEITALSTGTVTITASCLGESVTATVRVTQAEIYPKSINVFPNAVYLATQGTVDATVFSVVTANLMPGDATGDITWSSDTDIFNFNPSPDGRTVSIVPKDKQGFGYLTATARGANGELISTKCPVTISNKPVVADAYRNYIENSLITSDSPDSFKVNVYPIANPAIKSYEGKNVRQVTIFCWSNLGQTDINCKVANYESDGHFSYTFPVNGNTINNYFDRACSIKVSFYGSFEFENGNLINSFYYNYVNPNDFKSNVAVTPYIQNLGFEIPTVGNDELAGTEGRNLQLEGLRLSTPIDGLGLVYDVHVEDFGWTEQVSSGIYCGTMHLNKQIEAMHIGLTGEKASQYSVRYQVHAEGIGWMDWVSDGAQAGTVGQHRQIEAVRISIVPRT